jgi:hypothetical protein
MSATAKQLDLVELMRVAEAGDVEEFLRLRARFANVNAQNRHGTTALMKAACYGHEPMVRALLEHGADPNLTRNDRFTALALAAFFGHAETVNTLIGFGAKTDVVTRCGASARTWASARTYKELAKCLEMHAPVAVKKAVAPGSKAPPAVVEPEDLKPVVKTLKDPPEIWDLVHESPRNFNASSEFVARVGSMKRMAAVGVSAGLVLMICFGAGLFVLRSSRVKNPPPQIAPAPAPVEANVSEPAPVQPVVESPPVEVVNDNHARNVPNRARLLIRQPRSVPVVTEEPVEKVESREATAVAAPKFESSKPPQNTTKTNPNAPLSPNLISPANNTPPKGKVIQWP